MSATRHRTTLPLTDEGLKVPSKTIVTGVPGRRRVTHRSSTPVEEMFTRVASVPPGEMRAHVIDATDEAGNRVAVLRSAAAAALASSEVISMAMCLRLANLARLQNLPGE